MKVEIWSEVTCPWCGLGSHLLDRAVARFEHGEQVQVIHRSFPLSGGFPVGSTLSVREAMLRKHGMDGAHAEAAARRIEALAEHEGLSPYLVLDNTVGNTDLAHEFLAHASAEGKNRQGWDAIFRAYFGKAEPVFDLVDLLNLGETLGLDREGTRRALTDRRYRPGVHDEAHRAQSLGATGAPFLIVDGRYSVPGAQDSDTLLDLLRTAWTETHPLIPVTGAEVCGDDGCAVAPVRP